MLLAGVTLPGGISATDIQNTAIETDSAQISVTLNSTGTLLQIDGPHHGVLTLDLDKLPASITYLDISYFDTVQLTGTHDVLSLVFTGIQEADAGQIAINPNGTLAAFGVEHVKIDAAPAIVLLEGPDGFGSIGSKTLFEVGTFSSVPGATIYAWLGSLGLATNSHVVNLPEIITATDNEPIFLNFQPDETPMATTQEVSVITGGNFEQYFFASPNDQTSLEQSLLFIRHPITVDYVPLSTLLNESGVQVALGGSFDHGESIGLRPWGGNALALSQSGFGGKLTTDRIFVGQTTGGSAEGQDSILGLDFGFTTSNSNLPSGKSVTVETNPATLSELFQSEFQVVAQTALHASDALSQSLHSAAVTLAEPLTDLVAGLGAHIATFGDIMTTQVTEHMQVDRQFALLVDARPVRPAEERDLLILSV